MDIIAREARAIFQFAFKLATYGADDQEWEFRPCRPVYTEDSRAILKPCGVCPPFPRMKRFMRRSSD
jgi:hypothetical protein